MPVAIGRVEAVFQYPVKSMAGRQLESAALGWHGIEGDRRLALRRVEDLSGFPWLTGGKFPGLIRFAPVHADGSLDGDLPTHVRTPDGDEQPVFSDALREDVGRRYGAPVQMLHLRHGIFDDACVSVITCDTIEEIGRLAGIPADVRRFRPNVLVRLLDSAPFVEDTWLGGALTFGEGTDAAEVAVTMRDLRCSMINLDPDSAVSAPEILKAVARGNEAYAGIYGTVTRAGRLAVGQTVFLTSPLEEG